MGAVGARAPTEFQKFKKKNAIKGKIIDFRGIFFFFFLKFQSVHPLAECEVLDYITLHSSFCFLSVQRWHVFSSSLVQFMQI